MNKISTSNITKITNTSKKVIKPLLTGTLLASCCLIRQPKKDSFEKEETYYSPKEIQRILKKRGFYEKEIEEVINFQTKGNKEKAIVKSLINLTKTYTTDFPFLSFIKLKKEKPILSCFDFLKIIRFVSKKDSDMDFALELINLQKEKKEGKNTKKVPYWEFGHQLLHYIESIENPKLKELMQKYIHIDMENFADLEILCRANLDTKAMEKYQYLQKIPNIDPLKYIGTFSGYTNTNTEDFIKKFQILQNLTDSLDKDIYFYCANNYFSPEKWERIVKASRESNENNEEILETLTNLENADIELWEKLHKNPYLQGTKIYHIANEITYNNQDFILSLCEKEDFPKDIICGIAHRSKSSDYEIMKVLCSDDTIDKTQILKYHDQLQQIARINFAYLDINRAYKFLDLLKSYDKNIKTLAKKLNIDIDAIITQINNYLGIEKSTIKIEKEQQLNFFKSILANNNPEAEKVLRTFDFAQFGKKGLPLKYSRDEFNKKINNLLNELKPEEQSRVCSHFGLTKGALNGFNGLFNNANYENSSASLKEQEIAKEIQKEINKFTLENEVLIADENTKKVLDGLVQGFPEFTALIGKEQHGEHHYSVDIHSLLVLQKAMNNPLYETLNDSDKIVLKLAALLHDIGKREGIVDKGHAKTSSEYTRSILKKMNFSERIKHRIIKTVDSHHWFENFCEKSKLNNTSAEFAANEVLLNAHSPNDLKIFEILAKADFQSVSPTFHLTRSNVSNEKEFDKYIQEKMNLLEDFASKKLFSYSNFLKTTKFTTRLFPEKVVKIDGQKITLRVLNLHEISSNEDMRKYGFGCKHKKDLRFLVHMTHCDRESFDTIHKITSNPLMHKIWSTSLIKPGHETTFMEREYGGIFDADSSNILTAYKENISSGYKKNEEYYKNLITSNLGYSVENRIYLKKAMLNFLHKKGYKLTENDYVKLSQHILGTEDLNSLKDFKIRNQIISANTIIECIEKAQEELFYKNEQNEIVGIDLRLKALVAKAKKIEDCEPEFLRFARDNNLGIILI